MSTRHVIPFGLAAVLVLAACGSDESTIEPGTVQPGTTEPGNTEPEVSAPQVTGSDDDQSVDEVDLDAIRAELDGLEYESPTVDGVAVLGNQPVGEADSASTSPAVDDRPELAEDCAEGDDCPELDEIYGDDDPSVGPDPSPAEQPFRPNADWAPFCTVLAELEARPFPTDDSEALRTIDLWFRLLEPHVPASVGDAFGVLDDVVDQAVAADDLNVLDQEGDAIDDAADRIGRGIDAGCSGRGSLDELD